MEQFGASSPADRSHHAALVARGLLLALAAPSVAALSLDGGGRIAPALRMIGEIIALPAFFAVSGWLLSAPIASDEHGKVSRPAFGMALCGAAAAAMAAATGPLAGLDWRVALATAAPGWELALLAAVYGLAAHALRGAPAACLLLAVAAHLVGVILGAASLVHFVFYVAGALLAAHRDAFFRLVDEEPEFAGAAGPFVAVLATAVVIRFAQTGQSPSILAIGPLALAFGLAAGPAVLASASAISASSLGAILARLGRAAPALAIFWIPLFLVLIAIANRGLAPSAASALLMAASSLLIVATLADVALDSWETTWRGRFSAFFRRQARGHPFLPNSR